MSLQPYMGETVCDIRMQLNDITGSKWTRPYRDFEYNRMTSLAPRGPENVVSSFLVFNTGETKHPVIWYSNLFFFFTQL